VSCFLVYLTMFFLSCRDNIVLMREYVCAILIQEDVEESGRGLF
jgi:hypothetical protein